MIAKKNVTRATETLVYNIRGWMTSLQSPYFSQTLHYSDGTGTPCYNGNISSMTWKAGSETTLRGYKFTYDGISRLELKLKVILLFCLLKIVRIDTKSVQIPICDRKNEGYWQEQYPSQLNFKEYKPVLAKTQTL